MLPPVKFAGSADNSSRRVHWCTVDRLITAAVERFSMRFDMSPSDRANWLNSITSGLFGKPSSSCPFSLPFPLSASSLHWLSYLGRADVFSPTAELAYSLLQSKLEYCRTVVCHALSSEAFVLLNLRWDLHCACPGVSRTGVHGCAPGAID